MHDVTTHKIIIEIANLGGIFPLANGLLFFIGCFLSFSISFKSFNIYIPDDISEKLANPIHPLNNLLKSNNAPPKTLE